MAVTDGSYHGMMGWTLSEDENFENFIIRNSCMEIAVDFKLKKMPVEYTVVLNRTENNPTYMGRWSTRTGDSGSVNCQLFDYDDDILLFGNWMENNKPLKWWAILSGR